MAVAVGSTALLLRAAASARVAWSALMESPPRRMKSERRATHDTPSAAFHASATALSNAARRGGAATAAPAPPAVASLVAAAAAAVASSASTSGFSEARSSLPVGVIGIAWSANISEGQTAAGRERRACNESSSTEASLRSRSLTHARLRGSNAATS